MNFAESGMRRRKTSFAGERNPGTAFFAELLQFRTHAPGETRRRLRCGGRGLFEGVCHLDAQTNEGLFREREAPAPPVQDWFSPEKMDA